MRLREGIGFFIYMITTKISLYSMKKSHPYQQKIQPIK